MKVVTLPITPAAGRSFVTLLSPLVMELLAYGLQCESSVMLNTVGIQKSNTQPTNPQFLLDLYNTFLNGLGIGGQTTHLHDGSQDFEDYFQDVLSQLIKKGFVTESQMDISACACGRVEIPTGAIARIVGEYRRKKLIRVSASGPVCDVCGSVLKSKSETVALCHLKTPQFMSVFPNTFEKEARTIVSRMTSHPVVISRNRQTSSQITVGGYIGSVDVDFRWATFLGYAIPPNKDRVLVTSAATLGQAVKVMMLDSLLNPQERRTIVVHSLIRINDEQSTLSKLSAEDFLAQCGTPYVARTFLSLGLRWDAMEGTVDSGNLHLIQKSLPRNIPLGTKNRAQVTLEDIPKLLTRQNILGLLKKCRNKDSLNDEQEFLLDFLKPRS